MKERSIDTNYEKDGKLYSAFKRGEIIERDTETGETKVVGRFHYDSADKTRNELKKFNETQNE